MTSQILNPPTIEPGATWLADRRAHLVREFRVEAAPTRLPARSWRVALALAAALLLLAGAALAANQLGLLDWLRSSNPGEARFSIDPTTTVTWPAPDRLGCAEAVHGEFSCSAGADEARVYESFGRVEPQEEVTRERVLVGLADAEQTGSVSHERAEEIRGLIDDVGDDFFEKVGVLFTLRAVASPHQVRPGVYRVPPAGVPQIVTCRPDGSGFACQALPAATDVPVGAPVYGLRESPDWVERHVSPQAPDLNALIAAVFGRPLTPAEEQLLVVFSTPASAASGTESG